MQRTGHRNSTRGRVCNREDLSAAVVKPMELTKVERETIGLCN